MNQDAHQAKTVSDRIQALDWSKTPIGSVEQWPQSLKATIKTILGSRYPMILLWGDELIQIYNDAYTGLIGDKHPYALGRSIKETQAESWETIGPMIRQVMTTGVPNWVPAQLLAVNRSGFNEETYFSLSYSPVENDHDVISGMLCVCSEVTQQVLGERRLRLQRDLASRAGEIRSVEKVCLDLANAIADYPSDIPFAALYVKEANNKLKLSGTVRMTDGYRFSETFDARSNETDPWSLRQALSGEMAFTNDVQAILKVNGGAWSEPVRSAFTLPIPSSVVNDPIGVLIVGISPNSALDDSYRSFFELLASQVSVPLRNAQAYEEERKRAEALAQLDKAKTDFFSNVSHEFRTPLTLLLGPLKEVLDAANHPIDKDTRRQLNIVHDNALRLLKLVNALLDFSRMEANRAQATYRPTDLSTLTMELASSFESAVKKASLDFIVRCAPLSEPVYIDSEMWEKIVFNLISNALKFTAEGNIKVELTEAPAAVALTVTDTGVGIPEHELPNVFTRFHRVQNSWSRSHEGTGIGLSLVKELVALHGGTIAVSSQAGKGTTFTITIPKGTAHLDARAIQPALKGSHPNELKQSYIQEALLWSAGKTTLANPLAQSAVESSPHHQNELVLVVDDNTQMLEYLEKILRARWNVVTAKNGREALQLIQDMRPDLVLSDVMMPDVDGFQLLAEIRNNADWNDLPVILLSARAGQEATIEGLQKGANDYLVKPFYAQELLARVATQLEIKHTRLDNIILRESEIKFRTLAESIPEKVWTCDASGNLTFANRRMIQFTGLPIEALKDWRQFIHPEDSAAVRRIWGEAAPANIECRLRRNDGEYLWHALKAVPEMDDRETVKDWIGSCTDIHHQKLFTVELEKKVQERTAYLDSINKELEQFAYAASHDLQEPLRKILTFTELLQNKISEGAEDVSHYFKKITASSQRMKTLINDLLNFSRLSNPEQNFKPTNLNTIIAALKDDFELSIAQKDAQLEYDLLPVIDAIPFQINQLFYNLISNALKFTHQDRKPLIRLCCQRLQVTDMTAFPELDPSATYFRIDCIDNGVGFEPEYAEQIFDLFKRLYPNQLYAGTGVGLALCKKIALNHKGLIFATAEHDRGATFTVILPEKHQ